MTLSLIEPSNTGSSMLIFRNNLLRRKRWFLLNNRRPLKLNAFEPAIFAHDSHPLCKNGSPAQSTIQRTLSLGSCLTLTWFSDAHHFLCSLPFSSIDTYSNTSSNTSSHCCKGRLSMSSPRSSSSSSVLLNRPKLFPSKTLDSSISAESALTFPGSNDSISPSDPTCRDGAPKAKGSDVKLRSQISAYKVRLIPCPALGALEESFTPMVNGLSHEPILH
mmetsp:Transcript_12291/g.26442  ORF Transcript_12291/g.26442 Transcript_12291/m.26442 type:complete len:219 (+) Transcript_12291:704-1360(+)